MLSVCCEIGWCTQRYIVCTQDWCGLFIMQYTDVCSSLISKLHPSFSPHSHSGSSASFPGSSASFPCSSTLFLGSSQLTSKQCSVDILQRPLVSWQFFTYACRTSFLFFCLRTKLLLVRSTWSSHVTSAVLRHMISFLHRLPPYPPPTPTCLWLLLILCKKPDVGEFRDCLVSRGSV